MSNPLHHTAVPVSYVHLLYDYLEQHGLDAAELLGQQKPLAEQGLSRFPLLDWQRYLSQAAEHLDDPLLGIHLGQSISPRHLGILGYVLHACGDLGSALQRLEQYQRLIYDVNPIHRSVEQGNIVLSWGSERGRPGSLVDETAIAALIQFCRDICAQSTLAALRIDFINPSPPKLTPYEKWFLCPVHFEQGETRVVLHPSVLDQPVASANPELVGVLEQQARKLLAELPEDHQTEWASRVLQGIQAMLPTGQCSAAALARSMNLSARQLQRKLAAEGWSYRDLLRVSREKLARHYLADPRLKLSEIAALLAYSEQSAFTRSFSQWTGMSPGEYRRSRG